MPNPGWRQRRVDMVAGALSITEAERLRFEKFLCPEPNSGCLFFVGADNGQGYGMFGFRGRIILAHHFAWLASGRDIPADRFLLHKCDTPACVGWWHLYLGTSADNNADMVRRPKRQRGPLPRGVRARARSSGFEAYATIQQRYVHLGVYGSIEEASAVAEAARAAAYPPPQ